MCSKAMDEFLDSVAEVLEVSGVAPSDDFRQVPMWGSLMGFGLIVMIGQRYGRGISAADLAGAKTVLDLARLAGVEG